MTTARPTSTTPQGLGGSARSARLSPQGEAALVYAERGWPVVPLHSPAAGECSCGQARCPSIGKHPRTTRGLLDASTDLSTVARWWGQWPDANVGLRTGVWADVLDLDSAQAVEEFEHLVRDSGTDPMTFPSVYTAKGFHVYFQVTGGKNLVGLRSGWDWRGVNGYAVAPPSLHATGHLYEWRTPVTGVVPAAPGFLLQLLKQKSRIEVPGQEPIPEGKRNAALASMAGSMRQRGMSQAAIQAALAAENAARCQPPLDDDEVRQIAASVSRYEPGRVSMARWAGANHDSQGPTGNDPGSDSGGRRRGGGWQFEPPIQVEVFRRWGLRCQYASRNPQGAVRGQIEFTHGERVIAADQVLMGSAHGRAGFSRAILAPKGPSRRPRLSRRLARALLDLDPAIRGRIEGLEDRARSDRRGPRKASGLPEIITTGHHLREIADQSVAALAAANVPLARFFTFGTTLARLRHSSPVEIEPLTVPGLKGELDRAADYLGIDQGGVFGPVRPPTDVVQDLMALPELLLPRLLRVATTPVFVKTTDGARLLSEPGFDEASGVYLDPAALGPVDATMSAQEALDLLRIDLLGDFPLSDGASRAHALVMLLQPFVRDLIQGPTPIYGIEAPTQGSGKGLLAEVVAQAAHGHSAHPMALPRDDDELDKRITSALLAGHPLLLFDNVTHVTSSVLSAVLTTTSWRGRLLGESRMVTLPNLAEWGYTSNNPELSPEMVRRNVSIRLDSGEAHPERRTGWRHPDLLGWTRIHRAELVGACLSLVSPWVRAGMPPGSGTLGRFESWAEVLGGILEFHEVNGFLGDRGRLDRETDRETGEWVVFVDRWWATYRDSPITAGQALAVAKGDEGGAAPLLLALWGGRSHGSATMRVGHALQRLRDRRFGDSFIRDAGYGSTGGHAHRLERAPIGPAPRAGGSGDATASSATAVEGRPKAPKAPEGPVPGAPASAVEVDQGPEGSATIQELGDDGDAKLLAKRRTQTAGDPDPDSCSEAGPSGALGALGPPPDDGAAVVV